MNFSDISNIIQLAFTATGLIFVVFGWIIPYRQKIRFEKKQRLYDEERERLQWEKELIDDQISKLYGPLAELIEEQRIRWELIKYQLGREYIFSKDTFKLSDLSEEDRRIWMHFVDEYKIPTQNKMIAILRSNQHLIYKSEKPTGYKAFMEYSLGWEMLDNQKRNGVPNYYEYYYRFNYPIEFDHYVLNTLKHLQQRQGELIQIQNMPSTIF